MRAPGVPTLPGWVPHSGRRRRTGSGGDLAARLREALGDGAQVDCSTRRRAEYSSDASNYRVVPQAVLYPRHADDVQAAQAVCRELSVPMTSRGGGTSVAGNAIGPGLVMDFSRHLNRVVSVDAEARTAVVQPGVVLDDLQAAVAQYGLRFGPDPSTHARCTLGGMIANDACGSHALAYGRTSDNVLGLDVFDGTGRRFSTAAAPAPLTSALRAVASAHLATVRTEFGTFGRQVSGYALEHLLPEHNPGGGPLAEHRLARLLSGSEGTLATMLTARVRLVRPPAATALVVLGFPDMAAAAEATPALLGHSPLAMEGIDRRLVEVVRARGRVVSGLPAGEGWLFVEMGGADPAEARAGAAALMVTAGRAGAAEAVLVDDPVQARGLWRIREDGAGLAGRSPDGRPAWPGWEDAAVPPAHLGAYLRDFEKLLHAHHLDALTYGHFGDGCLHARIDFPLDRPGGAGATRQFVVEAAQLVASYGGSLSGEHGDGRARGELLPLMYSADAIAAFGQVKAAFDPDDLLNPGVLVRPSPLDVDLRLPSARAVVDLPAPRRGALGFAYPHDGGDFTAAVHRCVGVGKCRADSGGVMCPSFLATGDEKDSTRGRARLLQEMANGSFVRDGWQSEEVHESLDLCLSCKGCAVDCPAGVDMATYKSEFLDHHYRHRPRPRSHYALGWLPRWAHLAGYVPAVANAVLALPGAASALRAAGGIDQRRPIPRFAAPTFRRWFARRRTSSTVVAPQGVSGVPSPVILWMDTFTDNFDPAVGRAAVGVLEHLGFRVHVPAQRICCGLTWVSTGQLAGAKRQLRASLDALDRTGREIAGADGGFVPIVGLEPSCTALLREDAARLLPDDERAHDLRRRVVTLAELLTTHRPDWHPPTSGPIRKAVVQEHCHQHAATGFGPDRAVIAGAGIDATVLSGCCGLAGNFGAEKGHYDVSVAVAEHALLPAVRTAAADDSDPLLIADGFSCRTQTENLTGLRPRHLAEVLAEAIGLTGTS